MMTDGEREILRELESDFMPTLQEWLSECRANNHCVECGGDGVKLVGWDYEMDAPYTETCEVCDGSCTYVEVA